MKGRIILLSVFLVFLLNCSKEYVELKEVKEFIKKDPDALPALLALRGYNMALISSYYHNDIDPIKIYATERIIGRVSDLLNRLKSRNIRMEARLEQMRVERIERWGPDNIVIRTFERWKYRHVDIKTKREVKPFTRIEYRLLYNLVKINGRWKVFDITPWD